MDFRTYMVDTMAKAGFDRKKLERLDDAVVDAIWTAWEDDRELDAVLKANGLTLEFLAY